EEEQRDDADAASREPERLRAHAPSSGQPETTVLSPATLTSRAGRPCASSHRGASSSRNDAVLATFAATQVLAATLTVRQGDFAGRPVRGSTRWCSSISPLRQRRTALDCAAAPRARSA